MGFVWDAQLDAVRALTQIAVRSVVMAIMHFRLLSARHAQLVAKVVLLQRATVVLPV